MMIATMIATLVAALSFVGPAEAQAQKPKAGASAKAKSSSARAAPVPSRPAGVSAAEQSAFDRAAQSNH